MKKLLLTFICLLITVAYATAAGGGAVVFRTVSGDYGGSPAWTETTNISSIDPTSTLSTSYDGLTLAWTNGTFSTDGDWMVTSNGGELTITPEEGKIINAIGFTTYDSNEISYLSFSVLDHNGERGSQNGSSILYTITNPSEGSIKVSLKTNSGSTVYLDQIYVGYEDAGGDTPEPVAGQLVYKLFDDAAECTQSITATPVVLSSVASLNGSSNYTSEGVKLAWSNLSYESDVQFKSNSTLTVTPDEGVTVKKIIVQFFEYGTAQGSKIANGFSVSSGTWTNTSEICGTWEGEATKANPLTISVSNLQNENTYPEWIIIDYEGKSTGGGDEPEPEPDPNDPANWTLPDNYDFGGKVGAWVYGDKNVVTEVTYIIGENEPFVAPIWFVNPTYKDASIIFYRTQESPAASISSGVITVNSAVGTSIFTPATPGGQTSESAAPITINVQRPAAAVDVPELFVQDGPGNLIAFGSGFPVSPSNTLELKSTTEGVIYRYTLDGSDPTTSTTAVANNWISFTDADLDKTYTLKAVAYKDEDVSDVVEYTVTIHNWYLVDNNFVKFADNNYFVIASRQSDLGYAVGQTPSANGFTLGYFTITGTFGVPSDSQKLPAIFKKNGNFFEFLTKDTGVNRFLAHDTSALTSFANPTGNCTVSVGENGQFTLGSRFVQYSTNPYDFEIAASGASADEYTAKLYAWTAKPDYKLSFFLDNKSYESLGDVPYRVDLGKKLTVIFPEGFNPQYKGEPVANNTLEIEFDAPGQQNVEFSWTNSAGEKQNLLKTFVVLKWNLSWTPEGQPETQLTGDSGNVWVGSPVSITAPEGTDRIVYNTAGASESVASGQTMKLIFRNAGTFAYTFKAYDSDDALLSERSYTFTANKEDVTSDTQMIDFTANDYGFKVNDGNTSIVGGNLNAGCKDTGTAAEIFLPGGENFAALTEVDGRQVLKLGDNSAVRLGLGSGLQFVSITVNGTGLENIKVSGPTGDNGLGEFREVGNINVNADGTSATWIYSPTFEYELHTIQIWNNPAAESGVSTLAAGEPAYISSINFTTATSTGVNAVNVDDTVDLWFDLQGNAVDADALAPGLYIHISNGHAVKVLVK